MLCICYPLRTYTNTLALNDVISRSPLLFYRGTSVTQTHHSVALNSSQFEWTKPLIVRNQFKWPWSLFVPVIGKYQAVHVAGKRLIRLENQDVKNSVTYEGSRLDEVSGIAQPCAKIENGLMALIFLISLIPQLFLARIFFICMHGWQPELKCPDPLYVIHWAPQHIPRESWALMSAPFSMSSCTISSFPTQAANDKTCSPEIKRMGRNNIKDPGGSRGWSMLRESYPCYEAIGYERRSFLR